MMENDKIFPETPLRVLLRADEIPDKAAVSKRTGEVVYVLSRGLKIWGAPYEMTEINLAHAGPRHLTIGGFFLIGERGDINQILEDTLLH